jgi:hypothetical protein
MTIIGLCQGWTVNDFMIASRSISKSAMPRTESSVVLLDEFFDEQ